MEYKCSTAAATVTDHDLHQLQFLQCPSPVPTDTYFIKCDDDGPNSPTWLQHIFSNDGAYATVEPPLVRSPQDEIQLPPFPSEYWDTIGTETATDNGTMHSSPPPSDFFDFENSFLKMPPEDHPQYTGLLSDVVNFDSALDFPDRPEAAAEAEAGRCYGARTEPEPEPNLADEKKKKKLRFWTKDEHMLFVMGVDRYGKGNWKDIATKMVVTKTSTQVASHAQKYYDYHQNPNSNSRQRNGKSGRSKSSIFEITTVDPHSKARLLRDHALTVQPPLPPPLQQFTITNYYPPPHQPN